MDIKLIIGIIPIIIYLTVLLWTNKLINDKIKNKENKALYKKVFNRNLIDVFAPFFLMPTIIFLTLSIKDDKDRIFTIIFIFLNIIFLLIPLIGIAKIKYKYLKADTVRLKTKTENEIINGLK